MMEEHLDDTLRRAALEVNVPPPTPREAIWAGIDAARRNDLARYRRLRAGGRIRWAVGIAAVLLVGIGLGRWTATPPGAPSLARYEPGGSRLAYQIAATQHLSQAEALLTLTRSSPADELDSQTIVWAGDLLTTTRLLLDSQAAADPRLRLLLEDLELVLAEISHLESRPDGGPRAKEDLELVKESIEQGGVLPRLRAAVPSALPAAAL